MAAISSPARGKVRNKADFCILKPLILLIESMSKKIRNTNESKMAKTTNKPGKTATAKPAGAGKPNKKATLSTAVPLQPADPVGNGRTGKTGATGIIRETG